MESRSQNNTASISCTEPVSRQRPGRDEGGSPHTRHMLAVFLRTKRAWPLSVSQRTEATGPGV